jgi:hypothetical protein
MSVYIPEESSDESGTRISNTRRTAYDSKGVARLSRLKRKQIGACPTYQVCIM